MNYDENFIIICQKLGEKIKNIRIKKQITIKNMSDSTGISAKYLQKIEDGKAFGVLIERHLFKIANVLNIKLHDLLDF